MSATISVYLDTRVKKLDKLYPLKLRATFDRKRIYLGIPKERINRMLEGSSLEKFRYKGLGNFSIDEDAFNDAMAAKNRGVLRSLQDVFKAIEMEAQKKADTLEHFTFDGFKSLVSKNRSKTNKVFMLFDEIIGDLKLNDRVGTAKSYNNAQVSLKEFAGGHDVAFEFFTNDRLQKYQKWMKEKGNSDTTIGIYLRPLRAMFNEAISRDITPHYPFKRGNKEEKDKYKIPKGKGRKIALDRPDLKKIFECKLSVKHPYRFYLDMWKLMFHLGGINPTDLCMLKESNIVDGFIFYTRQKTTLTPQKKVDKNREAL